MSGVCPEGTVPIRRTSHDTNNFSNFSFSYAQLGQMNHAGPQRTEAVIDYSTHGPYLGASAALTLWDPHVEPNTNEYSNTFIMVGGVKPNKKANESLPFDNLDYQIALGWALDGGDQEVCINSECLLVQTSSKIFPGASLTQSSQPGGQISHIDVYIHRELSDDKWWVSLNHEAIGYYPKEAVEAWMFGSLTMRGALVFNTMPRRQHTSTQMGSGHFPSEGANYSAGIYDYYSVTNSGQLGIDPAKTIVTKPNCYNYMGLEPTKFNKSFLYGGPGGAGCDS
ncbi:hypothetical protein LUZ60_013860 [Juncus effusus]|nr:hypothetical protein LUZ60_013860 [Juncus effusus]